MGGFVKGGWGRVRASPQHQPPTTTNPKHPPPPPPPHHPQPPTPTCVEYSKSLSGPPGQYTQMLPFVWGPGLGVILWVAFFGDWGEGGAGCTAGGRAGGRRPPNSSLQNPPTPLTLKTGGAPPRNKPGHPPPPPPLPQTPPVVAMCGQRCGLLITATTAMPEAVRTGLARSWGSSAARCSSGTGGGGGEPGFGVGDWGKGLNAPPGTGVCVSGLRVGLQR